MVAVGGAESIGFVVLDDARALGLVETAALLDLIERVRCESASRLDIEHTLTASGACCGK